MNDPGDGTAAAIARMQAELLDLSHDAMIVRRREGTILYWNRGAERVYGWRREEVLGRSLELLLNPRALDGGNPEEVLTASDAWEGQSLHTRKDGAEIVVESRQLLQRDEAGEVIAVMAINRDVTRRKAKEAERERLLREAEEGRRTLDSLLEYIPEGITVADAPDVRIRKVSRYGRDLAGHPHEIQEGIPVEQHATAWVIFHADGVTPAAGEELPLARAVLHGEVVTDEEWVIQRIDGTRISVLCNAGPIRDAAGNITGGVVAWRDISERKRLEEARRHATELADANRLKDQFLAMLAHELRNPLAAISNAIYVLDEISSQQEVAVRLRSIVGHQTAHLARLVDDLLDISRLASGKINLQLEPIHLREVLDRALESCGELIRRQGHTLKVAFPERDCWLVADATRIEQVLSNLLINAAKYTPPGGEIRVEVKTATAEARPEAVPTDLAGRPARVPPVVEIRVRDNGRGIPPELLPRIFDTFTQAEQSLGRADAGLGLGLPLVMNLVEMHGGTVEAFSEGLNRGSEFVVRLPALREIPVEAGPGSSPATASSGRPLRVLAVEDDPGTANTLEELLELWGHEVRVLGNGPQALEVATAFRPEVVLLDIGLPGMDGYEVARRLRAAAPAGARDTPPPQGLYSPAPVLIALTGYGQESDRERGRRAGFEFYLVKPVNPEELKRLLIDLSTR